MKRAFKGLSMKEVKQILLEGETSSEKSGRSRYLTFNIYVSI